MNVLHPVRAILVTDTLRLLRDRFLLGASAYILGCALALRWLTPWLEEELLTSSDFDIGPFVPLGVSYFVLVNASVLTGMLGGFLLLEMREERTIKALLVTPTPLGVPLATLAAAVVVAGSVITVVLSALVGVGSPSPGAVLIAAVLGAPMGFVMTLVLATVASNKVEAFAVMKITAFAGLLPVGGYFIPEPFQYLVGVSPSYWACKIWWESAAGRSGWAWMVIPGVVVSAAWILILIKRFRRAAYR